MRDGKIPLDKTLAFRVTTVDVWYPDILVCVARGGAVKISRGCRWFTFDAARRHWELNRKVWPPCTGKYHRAVQMLKMLPCLKKRAAARGWLPVERRYRKQRIVTRKGRR
jgi:hypothetical protein